MKWLAILALITPLAFCGCETDIDSTPANPDADVDVHGTPDLDPTTDDDVDIDIGGNGEAQTTTDGRPARRPLRNLDVDVDADTNDGDGINVDVKRNE